MRRLAPLLVVLLSAPALAAPPAPYVDPRGAFQVVIPEGWQDAAPAEPVAGQMLAYANEATGQLLVVTRVLGPNDVEGKPELLLAAVERGLKETAEGYRRLSAKKLTFGKKRNVPGYDLWFRVLREGRPVTLGARFLFYRSYALALMVETPGDPQKGRAGRQPGRQIVESFTPVKK